MHPYMSTTSSVAYLNSDGLNSEQIQAVNCIVEAKNYPVPYLLYGPPGEILFYDFYSLFIKIVFFFSKELVKQKQ